MKKVIIKVPRRYMQTTDSREAFRTKLEQWEKGDTTLVLPDDVEVIVIDDLVKIDKEKIEVHVELDE